MGPWEMLLMKFPRCKNLIMRDKITADNLKKKIFLQNILVIQ